MSPAAISSPQAHDVSIALLKANDFVARAIRAEMAARGIALVNIVSSAGSGKTALLEATVQRLRDRVRVAVLEGDLETERDAERIRRHGIPAVQITTGGVCHLEAPMIMQALEQLPLDAIDLLIIENVGNLVCPAGYDLGEDLRVTLLAVTEGDDKPRKYPRMFLTTDLMVVSKADLLPYCPFSVDAVIEDARAVKADLDVLLTSATSGLGVDVFADRLVQLVSDVRARRAVT
ncbi:MAG: hydrogenase nickel incorporation protein HypB [Gemmatimonadaceae bacterium]|jgi:hydrogenase nickel incorporation protein HypB|nr:hydrogenase nickel incorporation protein HypB [Gemmatimonadaceae bacterium]